VSRILIIDDDAVAGPEMLALLAGEFHDAALVKDAAAGILALASSRFDLVIIDIFVTRMAGLALIARLRALGITLPIIGMTGVKLAELMCPSLDFVDLAIEAGATCCLRRPIEPRHLLEAVNSNLDLAHDLQAAKLQPGLPRGASLGPEVAILVRAAVPRELREALAVLRQYVQELERETESRPYRIESIRDMATCAFKAMRRLFQIIEPNGETDGGACDTAEAIALNNRTIGLTPVPRRHRSLSSGRERLTPREREVLALVTDGVSNKVGGFRMSISVRTFEAHRANVMGKLGARNAAELVRFGLEGAT
jgi:FixJ family two-component response regulator